MADIEVNASETLANGESTVTVIIEDDIERIHVASKTSHKTTEANHEATVTIATVQTEGEL